MRALKLQIRSSGVNRFCRTIFARGIFFPGNTKSIVNLLMGQQRVRHSYLQGLLASHGALLGVSAVCGDFMKILF